MDEPRCRDFFLQPSHTHHRRYEALRAFFIDHRPLPEIAQVYGYHYGTLRNLVTAFRAQCRTGQVPPFLSVRNPDAPAATTHPRAARRQNYPPWPTAANSASGLAGASVPV